MTHLTGAVTFPVVKVSYELLVQHCAWLGNVGPRAAVRRSVKVNEMCDMEEAK